MNPSELARGKSATGYALRTFPRAFSLRRTIEKENFKNQLFATLIHSCWLKTQRPDLGQYSISANMFAEHERESMREKLGDPLVGLSKHVDFVALSNGVDAAAPRPSRAKGGRPPYPTVLMVKILVLQQLYNLADDALEYQLLDRRSFLQFLDLAESSSIPDAKTIWLFRDHLAQAGAGTQVFEQVQR